MSYSSQPPPPHPHQPQPPPGYTVPSAAYGYPGARPGLTPISPSGLPLAEFGERLLAWLIDVLIVTVAALVVTVPVWIFLFVRIMDSMGVQGDAAVDSPWPIILLFLALELALVALVVIFRYVYEVEMARRTGRTVGKRVMGLRIVPLDPSAALDRTMLAKRFLVSDVAGLFVPFLSLLDGLWQLWDRPYRQCLHDKFAQTIVVKSR